MIWHRAVLLKLEASGLFRRVDLVGAKVRAIVDATRFLDVHYDPTTSGYSYAFVDMKLSYPGDKRLFGWDDYPHEGVTGIEQLGSYPHHFQYRAADGSWVFEASPMRGQVVEEMDVVIAVVRERLQHL
jgi:hypothetical protein